MTEDQLKQIAGTLVSGCPLETAADWAELDLATLEQAMAQNVTIATRLKRAQATGEVSHMQNVKNAAADSKNWRASVWWLEHCRPDKYGRRPPDAIPAIRWDELIDLVAQVVTHEVRDAADRHRAARRLSELVANNASSTTEVEEVDDDEA